MALIELHVELTRVADSLEKIVFLLEKLVFPPPPAAPSVRQSTLDDLHIVTAEDHQRMTEEQAAFAERYQVVPGSEAMAQALQAWEDEQRSVYGETWQAPEDWKTIFAAAERAHRADRKPAGPGSAVAAEAPERG